MMVSGVSSSRTLMVTVYFSAVLHDEMVKIEISPAGRRLLLAEKFLRVASLDTPLRLWDVPARPTPCKAAHCSGAAKHRARKGSRFRHRGRILSGIAVCAPAKRSTEVRAPKIVVGRVDHSQACALVRQHGRIVTPHDIVGRVDDAVLVVVAGNSGPRRIGDEYAKRSIGEGGQKGHLSELVEQAALSVLISGIGGEAQAGYGPQVDARPVVNVELVARPRDVPHNAARIGRPDA